MTPPPARATPVAVALGVLALWQLFYLPASNVLNFVPRRPGPGDLDPQSHLFQEYGSFTTVEPLQRAAEGLGEVFDFWSEVTGQEQGWKMFVPGPPSHSAFPALELHFADGTKADVRSTFEPIDLHNPAPRPPLIRNRVFNYHMAVVNPGEYSTPDALSRFPESWGAEIPRTVRYNQGVILAWMKWNVARHRAEHPQAGEPSEVVLKYRYIPIPKPDEPRDWGGPVVELPYARWAPGKGPRPGFLPVEAYHPITGALTPLRAENDR